MIGVLKNTIYVLIVESFTIITQAMRAITCAFCCKQRWPARVLNSQPDFCTGFLVSSALVSSALVRSSLVKSDLAIVGQKTTYIEVKFAIYEKH